MAVNTPAAAARAVGDYDLIEKIGDGGMGSVYKARHRTTGAVVAIKIVTQAVASDPTLLRRFERESRVARSLDHPHIVRGLDFGVHQSTPYLVMEFVDGESLGDRIERQGRLPEAEAVRVIAQVGEALQLAHDHQVIHRDVKPDNILLTARGEAKLADLGLAKQVGSDLNLTQT